jgi:RES domain-containing protein
MIEYPKSLLEQLGGLATHSFAGTVFRWTFEGFLPERPNTRGARWNPPGTTALYTGFSLDVVRAESEHLVSAQGIPPSRARQMHHLSVRLKRVLQLTDIRLLRRFEIDDATLRADDYSKCQLIGGAVERLGHDGLIIPSARGPANNLVIFPNNVPFGDYFEVIATEPLND